MLTFDRRLKSCDCHLIQHTIYEHNTATNLFCVVSVTYSKNLSKDKSIRKIHNLDKQASANQFSSPLQRGMA